VQGFKVFPLQPRGKKPLTAHGLKDATGTIQGVREYWPQGSQNNIGLVCDGLLVCDFDGTVDKKALPKWKPNMGNYHGQEWLKPAAAPLTILTSRTSLFL